MKHKILEVKSSDWSVFCKRISKEQAGATVKVEVVGSNGVSDELSANGTFESLAFDATGACNNLIALRLSDGRPIAHEIIDPVHIRLNQSEAGDCNQLEVKAENGITSITFHPAIRAEWLAGLKTA